MLPLVGYGTVPSGQSTGAGYPTDYTGVLYELSGSFGCGATKMQVLFVPTHWPQNFTFPGSATGQGLMVLAYDGTFGGTTGTEISYKMDVCQRISRALGPCRINGATQAAATS